MERREDLEREIGRLETRLDHGNAARELATIRRDLAGAGVRKPAIELPNLKIGFACKERWEDMQGEGRVRACGGCDRPVFDLSAMTRGEAERLLATRGLTPCVRFYRRPDGTVMTADCPTGEKRERRRLAVVASSIAAGTALASPAARAEPAPDADATSEADAANAEPPPPEMGQGITIDSTPTMGIPLPPRDYEMGGIAEMGVIVVEAHARPAIEWSLWGRLGMGLTSKHASVLARTITPPEALGPETTWEGALALDLTVDVANDGNLRLGAWGEVRTSTGPVAGGELVVGGLPPHPMASRIGGSGNVVLRAGGNGHVFTAAFGLGYVGSYSRDPWLSWIGHAVGGRIVASMNQSLDDPHDWSMTVGLELEPIGVIQSAIHAVKDD